MGTNEVGIPVKFAKELHYPTPVSTWNIKLMRELVERGPHQYPGRQPFVCLRMCVCVCLICLVE